MTTMVSAIIPCFNYGRFVARAIESVFAQTYPHVECIVVDDGSTDDTAAVLGRYEGRARVVRQSHRGVSAARNAAIGVAQGRFIALLDGDDWWQPEKLSRQIALLDAKPHVGCVGCGLEHIYPDGRAERISGRANTRGVRETQRAIALRQFWVAGSGSGAVIRRTVLDQVGLFDEGLVAGEDWDMWLRLSAATGVDNVPDILVSINRHGTGVFRNAALMETNQWLVYQKIVRLWPDLLSAADRRRLKALILADAARESPARRDAVAYYLRSLKEWPFHYPRMRAAAIQTVRLLQAALPGRAASAGRPA